MVKLAVIVCNLRTSRKVNRRVSIVVTNEITSYVERMIKNFYLSSKFDSYHVSTLSLIHENELYSVIATG